MSTDDQPDHQLELLINRLGDKNCKVRRDAADALGKLGDRQAVEPLIRAFQHTSDDCEDGNSEAVDNSEVRICAALALGKIGDGRALEPLIQELDNVNIDNLTLCWYVIDALGLLGDAPAVGPLIKALDHADIDMRKAARSALAKIGEPAVLSLLDLLKEAPSVWAIQALERIGDQRAIEPLVKLLLDKTVHEYTRGSAAIALGELHDERAFELLMRSLGDVNETSHFRGMAARGLGRLGDQRAFEPLVSALGSQDWGMRVEAARGLGNLRDSRAVGPLIPLLSDDSDEVCLSTVMALGQICDDRAVPALMSAEVAAHSRFLAEHIKWTIAEATRQITKQN